MASAEGAVPGIIGSTADLGEDTYTVYFDPTPQLTLNTTYTATISDLVTDISGVLMNAPYAWSFTTRGAPTVISTSPTDEATGVALGSDITATFSEAMDEATLTDSTFTATSTLGSVTGVISYDASTKTVTFNPSSLLANNITYTATLSTDVKNPAGIGLASAYTWSFTTKAYSASLLYTFNGEAADDYLGWAVASAGDVNADGKADLIVGAYFTDPGGEHNAGSAYIYSGSDGSLLRTYNGVADDDGLGFSVAPAGNIDGDSNADIIIGALGAGGATGPGSVYVYSGDSGALIYTFNGEAANDNFGYSAASAGDVNGDGTADIIVGANGADPGGKNAAGSAYIYSGSNGALLYDFDGGAANDNFGISVSSAGDVNGDGNSDFIVGAHATDPGGINDAGSAYVYSGDDGSLLYTFNGGEALDCLGWSVASAGDVDGDGTPDIILGAYGADPGSIEMAGSAYIYSGRNGTLLYTLNGGAAGDFFGAAVNSAGDVNGDGKADLIVGAYTADPGSISKAGSAYVYISE